MFISSAKREAIEGYLYIAPWLVGFLVFAAGPMLVSLFLSLTEYKIITPPDLVGIENYTRMFTDDLFWRSLWNTVYYALIFVPVSIGGSLTCALLLNQRILGRTIFRAVYFLPSITPIVATAFLWLWIFQPNVGLANYLLSELGIEGPRWLDDIRWSKPALILISLWGSIGGGAMLIFLAGLQGIPEEYYDAAKIDGANVFQRLRRVTIPLMTPTIYLNTLINIIGSFQVFAQVFIMTAGGPRDATRTYVMHLFDYAFQYLPPEMGYASALAWLLFLIIFIFTAFIVGTSRRWVFYQGMENGNG